MRKSLLLPHILFTLVGCLFLFGGIQRSISTTSDSPSLTVIFNSQTNGYLTPCGCSKPMIGGLPRRANLLRALEQNHTLLKLENGDLTKGLNRQDELKAETLIEMFNELGYEAINLGETDYRLGIPFLMALQRRFRGALLSSNALQNDRTPLFKDYLILEYSLESQTVKIVLIGLISKELLAPYINEQKPELKLETPSDTLERLTHRIEEGDIRILLYHGSLTEAEALAERFHQFQLIVYAHEGASPEETKRVGDTVLVCNGQDGKYIGVVSFQKDYGQKDSIWRVQQVYYEALKPEVGEDPKVMALKLFYLQQVAEENLLAQVPRKSTLNNDVFAGSKVCKICHSGAYEVWEGSAHSSAYETLEDEKHEKDPECVICHVVGLDYQGGFQNMEQTPHLKDVGCESCHGPSSRHTEKPYKHKPDRSGPQVCLQCHVPEHSPNFDFETYWEKIRH